MTGEMKETKLLIIRHGQSIGNLERRFLGHTDLDLSELGYKQAEIVAEYLKNEKIDAVYSSDLKRAYNTVKPIAECRDLKIKTSKNLREIYAGEWENGDYEYLSQNFSCEYEKWKTDIGNAYCNGGESVIELQDRVYEEVMKIAIENIGKTVCIGTHATPIRTLYAKIEGIKKDDMYKVPWATNASVTTVLYSNGNLKMVKYAEDEFMGENVTRFSKGI